METTELIPAESRTWITRAVDFCRGVVIQEIKTPDDAAAAAELFKQITRHADDLEVMRARIKKPYWDAGVAIDAEFKEPKTIVEGIKTQLDFRLKNWNAFVRAEKAKEQARLDLAAAEERRKIEEQARKQREKEQAALEAEEAAQRAAAAATSEEERRKAQAEIDRAKKASEAASAAAMLKEQAAARVVAPIAAPVQVNTPGVTTKTELKVKIIDPVAAVRYLAENLKYDLLCVDEKMLKAWAKKQAKEISLPGMEIFFDEKIINKSSRF